MTAADHLLSRIEAVALISAAYAGRKHYIISAGPGLAAAACSKLTPRIVTGSVCFVDSGETQLIFTFAEIEILIMPFYMGLVPPPVDTCAVLTIPKTVPAKLLSEVYGQDIGDRDCIILNPSWAVRKDMNLWPELLLDAIAVTDPKSAASIRLHNISSNNLCQNPPGAMEVNPLTLRMMRSRGILTVRTPQLETA